MRIRNIREEYDADLNGKIGTLRQPIAGFPDQDVGIELDEKDEWGRSINVCVRLNEFEVIWPWETKENGNQNDTR